MNPMPKASKRPGAAKSGSGVGREAYSENRAHMADLKDPAKIRRFLVKGESVVKFLRLKEQVIEEFAPVGKGENRWTARIVVMRWRKMRLVRKQETLVFEAHKLIKRHHNRLPIPKLLRVLSVSPYPELLNPIMDINLEINMLDRSCLQHSLRIKASKLQRQEQPGEDVAESPRVDC